MSSPASGRSQRALLPGCPRVHALALALAATIGCAGSDRDRRWVSAALEARGFDARGLEGTSGGEEVVRVGAVLDETDVAALALAASPTYRAELTRIDAARADLDEASRPANPQITLAAALGPISAFATLLAPLESLWQIPLRTEAAARALASIAESLVQGGLDVVRDARLAHAELVLAETRVVIVREVAAAWTELASIARARAEAGEVSPAEAALVQAQASAGLDAVQVQEHDVRIASARLAALLGLEADRVLHARFAHEPEELPTLEALLASARASRPDVQASELAMGAAAARAGWERSRVIALAAQIEGHWTQPDTLAMRLGARLELPIFSANQGGIGRAEAEARRSEALLEATRVRVSREVVEAHARAMRAEASLRAFRETVLPQLEEAHRVAARGFAIGEETQNVALDALRQLGEARLREAELVAEAHRAEAELERAVGARLHGGRS
ncbi:MAG: TolC family protein [Sandaracinus sp.]